jgi:hypothetical protein
MDDDETADARKEGVAYMYIILAGICFCATIFMILFVPETKGPSIARLFPLTLSPTGKSPEDFMGSDVTHYKGEKIGKHEGELARPLTTDFDSSSGKSY